MLNGEEIQSNLRAFVAKWGSYTGTERSESQTFLNELFAAFGTDRTTCGAQLENSKASDGYMDLYWDGVCIIEMKSPAESARLERHRKQALGYWANSADLAAHREQPPYVVLCSFQRFEVFEPGKNMREPLAAFDLAELPDHFEAVNFLAGRGILPLFGEFYRDLTTDAAKAVADLYHSVRDRDGAPPEEAQRFVLQIAWCLFAEDLGMLSGHPVQRIIEKLISDPSASSYAEFGALFDVLNDPADYGRKGVLAGTTYVNGSLFEKAARVHLEREELELLRTAAEFDWRGVDPTIFGSLMEGCLGRDLRWKLGAHYTYEADIMRIVGPTIVRPWRQRIDAAATPAESLAVLRELCGFRVLDPSCGCGNFLYVAYREIRALEYELKQRVVAQAVSTGLAAPDTTGIYYPLTNLQGIEIEPIVAQIARITLWMGHKQVSDKYGAAENVLPLVSLANIVTGDALRIDWPATDAIIGNPPFLGDRNLRRALGDDYVEWLKHTFRVGIKDLCTYWFRRAHEHLEPGQRAGLVGTNSISQNRAREASLQYIVDSGGVILDAVSSQKWPGDAQVHVSLVNWVKGPDTTGGTPLLDGMPVSAISPELRAPGRSTADAAKLVANRGRASYGPVPIGDGFIVTADEAAELLVDPQVRDASPPIVRPYLTGADLADVPGCLPSRWTIDFATRPLERAMGYPNVLSIVRARVKPTRDSNRRAAYRNNWWLFGEPCKSLRASIAGFDRYIVGSSTGKRLLLCWGKPEWIMNNSTNVFAFDDDYSMGVLLSAAHDAWAWSRSSTLETRLRYTTSSVFETFAWPDSVSDERRGAVAEASVALLARRDEICATEGIGLTTLYNMVDEGAYTDLKSLHRVLDEAVAEAYGWPKSVAQLGDELVDRRL